MTNGTNAELNDMSFWGSDHVESFGEMILRVRNQIDAGAFGPMVRDNVDEIVRIIAEMFVLPPDAGVSINGITMPASYVREIYSVLEHEHIEMVLEHYRLVSHEIRFPKTYIRTALYNAAFELDARMTNDARKNQ